jgi:hypothetical protein
VDPKEAPGMTGPGAVYGVVKFFDFGQTKFTCGLRRSSNDAEVYDVFFIDLNHNGTLQEDEVLKMYSRKDRGGDYIDCYYGVVNLTLQDEDGPRTHRAFVWRRGWSRTGGELYLVSHCYMTGRIRLGDKEVTAVLVDYDCDGRYDSGRRTVGPPGPFMCRGFDKVGWDKDGDGKIQWHELHYISGYALHEGKVYRVEALPDGELLAALPVEVPMGRLQMPAKNATVRLVGEVGPIDLRITDSVIDVPAGTYWVASLMLMEPGDDGKVRRVSKSGMYFDETWKIQPNSVLKIERTLCEVTQADKDNLAFRRGRRTAQRWQMEIWSMLGEPLGLLGEFEIDLDPEKVKGKRILVCFWDMQQRPARHCVRELAKRAEELKGKGIVVAIVQASKVEKSQLEGWIKEYDIPFAAGAIEGDAEQIRAAWGIKALPSLILTDAEHIVRAEGFGIAELDERIKAISRK